MSYHVGYHVMCQNATSWYNNCGAAVPEAGAAEVEPVPGRGEEDGGELPGQVPTGEGDPASGHCHAGP